MLLHIVFSLQVKSAGTRAGPGAKGGASNEEVAALKREIRELKACIKQLETEARRGGVGVAGAAGDGGASEVREGMFVVMVVLLALNELMITFDAVLVNIIDPHVKTKQEEDEKEWIK